MVRLVKSKKPLGDSLSLKPILLMKPLNLLRDAPFCRVKAIVWK